MEPTNPTPASFSLWSYVSENPLGSAVVGTLIAALIIWFIQRFRAQRDSAAIYKFLRQSKEEGRFEFRSTVAISSHTKLPEGRVEELCSRHSKIRRNEKERQTWHLVS